MKVWEQTSEMSFTAVGGNPQGLRPTGRWGPADTHHQGAIGVQGSTDRQGVHVLREQGLMGERVADAAIIQYLKDTDGKLVEEEQWKESCWIGLHGQRRRQWDERSTSTEGDSEKWEERCEGEKRGWDPVRERREVSAAQLLERKNKMKEGEGEENEQWLVVSDGVRSLLQAFKSSWAVVEFCQIVCWPLLKRSLLSAAHTFPPRSSTTSPFKHDKCQTGREETPSELQLFSCSTPTTCLTPTWCVAVCWLFIWWLIDQYSTCCLGESPVINTCSHL